MKRWYQNLKQAIGRVRAWERLLYALSSLTSIHCPRYKYTRIQRAHISLAAAIPWM
jgi:hypothetical protein